MRRNIFNVRQIAFVVLCGLTVAFTSCANNEVAQTITDKSVEENKNLTTFSTGEGTTRTSLNYNNGAFFWEAGDHIYVKDDDGNWNKSSNAPTQKTASFRFKVPGKYTASTKYKVYYPGKNGFNNQVSISATQNQSKPNNTEHIGEAGDCGTADATGSNGVFSFSLDHQAAILVFLPNTPNVSLQNCYLTKIEVSSDQDITDTYTLDTTSGKLTGEGQGKQIVLNTKGTGAYANGFPLKTNVPNETVNAAYMVIKPGTHVLTVKYWVKDVATGVEGVISKTFSSFNYEKNDYYDMTYALNVRNYDGHLYHMWDARNNYWAGHEWDKADVWQPTLDGGWNGNYDQLSTTGSNYNNSGGMGRYDAINSCKNAPNANEMAWYVKKGDPRWDDNELWTSMGHLYKGGMWFKTKSYLQMLNDYDVNRSPINIDLRETDGTVSATPTQGPPHSLMRDRYFFVPAAGEYSWGVLDGIGTKGGYWSSSCSPQDSNWAYGLEFSKTNVKVFAFDSYLGFRTSMFE